MGLYIKCALESKENDCTRVACGIISDLASNLEGKLSPYLDDFVPCLHVVLNDTSMDRKIKLNALIAIGDICTYCWDSFKLKFLSSTFTILSHASRVSIQLGEDQESIDFYRELRETIMDQYTTLILSAENDVRAHYEMFLEGIFDFIEQIINVEQQSVPQPRTISMCISLIGDIASQFQDLKVIRSKATAPHIEQAIIYLQSQQNNDYKLTAMNTLAAVKKIL